MYTERELAEMDKGSLIGLVASMQENDARYRWLKENVSSGSFGLLYFEGWISDDTTEWDEHIDHFRHLSDDHLTTRTLDALSQ